MLTFKEMQVYSSKIDSLFSSTTTQQSQLDNLANTALSRGTDAFTQGNYDAAISAFKMAIGLSPYGDNTIKAYQLMVNAYQQQGKTDEAIKAWKQASSLFPQSDIPHSGLGDIYFSQKNYSAAEKEYTMAVKLNSTDSSNNYSLGQAYMAEGKYSYAEAQFKKVIQIKPQDPSGYYALGQNYHKMGRYDDAVTQLNNAILKNRTFADAYLELGKTYTDMKETDKAYDQVAVLNKINQSSSAELQNYMAQVASPKFIAAYSLTGFNTTLGPGTSLSAIDSSLSAPGSSKLYTMNFTFSKDMDPQSVQNISNWLISRATTGSGPGGAYNWGLAVKPTEAAISPLPIGVSYNSDTRTATVSFKVSQNSQGNGTLDPSHILFQFSGTDTNGISMDLAANQYDGISQII